MVFKRMIRTRVKAIVWSRFKTGIKIWVRVRVTVGVIFSTNPRGRRIVYMESFLDLGKVEPVVSHGLK